MAAVRRLIPLAVRLRLYERAQARNPPARRYPGLVRGAAGVALTFDDGPDPDATPAVLDALDRAGARATFFVVGEQLEHHAAIARDAVARGHELGLHAYAHRRHAAMGDEEMRADLRRAHGQLAALIGRAPRWYRPPFGRFSDASYAECAALGMRPVYWSGWGLDWEPLPAERIAALATRGLAAGSIVLLHDSARYAPRPDATATAAAVAAIAAAAARHDLPLLALADAV
jgi:peptidoglycan/xylan/chitin deacetylase (PgdA/CDA1 family)